MKVYLLENYRPDLKFDENSIIVALTPEACYRLDRAEIEYSIIEDYYSEEELLSTEDSFSETQLRWINQLDDFLQSNVEELQELKLQLGTLYYYYLKTGVLDPLFIRCYTITKLVESIKPSQIAFFSNAVKEPDSGPVSDTEAIFSNLRIGTGSLYSQVIPLVCATHGIGYQLISVLGDEIGETLKSIRGNVTIVNKLKRMLRKYRFLRAMSEKLYFRMQFTSRYFRSRATPDKSLNRRLNILILNRGAKIWPDIPIDALKHKHNVYELSGESILKHSRFRSKKYLQLRDYRNGISKVDSNIWEQTVNRLEGSDLITSIIQQYQLDVSQLITPSLKHFITQICPDVLEFYKIWIYYFAQRKLDFIIAPYAISSMELGAIAAADLEGMNTVCIVHGDQVFGSDFWRNLEFRQFRISISSNSEFKQYYERMCRENGISTEFYYSPYRLMNVKKIDQLRLKEQNRIRPKRIIYLPTMLLGDKRRLQNLRYADNWYYKFQKSLIEYFATKTQYTFVWKGLPVSDAILNPIPNFIRDSQFSNIEIATNSFVEHLSTAEAVICDYPSTGFYESSVAGLPTMSLYLRSFKVRDSAIEQFGHMLRPFSDIPEAIDHIEEFLNGDPELYKASLDTGNDSILHILEKIAEK